MVRCVLGTRAEMGFGELCPGVLSRRTDGGDAGHSPVAGITVVSFNQAYWNTYYVGRPWYGQWSAYYYRPAVVR